MKRGQPTIQSDQITAYLQSDLNTTATVIYIAHAQVYGNPFSVTRNQVAVGRNDLQCDFNSKWGRSQDFSQLLHYTQVGLVTLYVDGMLVSGPRENHSKFWHELGKHLKFEELQLVNRVLGRNRIVREDVVKFEMDDFTQECWNKYLEITGEKGFKDSADPVQGALQHCAAKLIMKASWLACLNRPDDLRSLRTSSHGNSWDGAGTTTENFIGSWHTCTLQENFEWMHIRPR